MVLRQGVTALSMGIPGPKSGTWHPASGVVQNHNMEGTWQTSNLIAMNCEIAAEVKLLYLTVSTYATNTEVGWGRLMVNISKITMGPDWPNSMESTFVIHMVLESPLLMM